MTIANTNLSQDIPITSELDITQLYFGYRFKVNDAITIRQPTVEEIVNSGESNYYKMVHALTSIPYDHMSYLWDIGIDFTKLSELEFFYSMSSNLDVRETRILFGDTLDFRNFAMYPFEGSTVLYDKTSGIIIDSVAQKRISEFLCYIHRIKKERLKPAGRKAKEEMINLDRQERKAAVQKKDEKVLLPLVSSLVNHPGFKYNLDQTRNLNIFFFMDCVSRILKKENVDQLALGYYSGVFDTKKFKPETQLAWTGNLYD